MHYKRTPEGLEFAIDKKIYYDMRNWPDKRKKPPKRKPVASKYKSKTGRNRPV
ncbi:hypothetical protein LXEBMM8_EKPBGFGD_00858 [Lactiplantibacillus xiangfangensis]